MSFNLNKTDGEAKSAFDLDKGAQGGAGAAKGGSDEKSPSKMLWLVIAVIAIGGLAWMMTGGQGEEEKRSSKLTEQQRHAGMWCLVWGTGVHVLSFSSTTVLHED